MKNVAPTTEQKAMHRVLTGVVVTAPGQKTIQVVVKSIKMHPKYHKQFATAKKFAVHDEKNEAKVGDVVHFQECRPLSKNKRWRLIKV